MRMLSQVLRKNFFEFGKKYFWVDIETIYKCQQRGFHMFALLGTLKIIKNIRNLMRML
jgi:hypothetical protein